MKIAFIKITIEVIKQALAYMLAPAFFIFSYDFLFIRSGFSDIGYEKPLPSFFFNILIIVFVLLYFFVRKKEFNGDLFVKKLTAKNIFIVCVIGVFSRLPLIILAFVIILVFGDKALNMFDDGVKMQWEGMENMLGVSYWLTVITVSVLVPIHEELFFRGVVFNYLKKHISIRNSVIFSSLLFAVFHLHPGLYPATFVLGLILSVIYHRLGNIWYAILLHMLINVQPFIFEAVGLS
jgi:membrane protease YdiL (CAAX protease family)